MRKRRITRRQVLASAAVFIIISSILGVILTHRRRNTTSFKVLEFDPCQYIHDATSHGSKASITFTDTVPEIISDDIDKYFGYQSKAFGLPMIVRPGIAKKKKFTGTTLTLEFPLPFVQNYTGHIFCVNPKRWSTTSFQVPRDLLPEVDNFVPLNFNIEKFSSKTNYSQMKCFADTFETRYCEMRRVSIFKHMFVFSTQVDYVFPEPFLSAGGRSAPFDVEAGRLVYEPIVIHTPINMVTNTTEFISGISYVISRFYNNRMLWHTVADFLVPAFHTFSKIEGKKPIRDRNIFIRDDQQTGFYELEKSLSTKKIINMLEDNVTRTFERVIVGLEKLEHNPSAARGYQEMLNIKYDFRSDTAPALRSEVMRSLKLSESPLNVDNPLIVIIERRGTSRKFLNSKEIEQYMLNKCPFCDITRVDFRELRIEDQVELMSKAMVLVAVHGSGIAHVAWMSKYTDKFPSSVVEILPHGYVCRDWFEGLAAVANVKYYKVMSGTKGMHHEATNMTQEKRDKLKICWEHHELCSTFHCHDTLRDQHVWLDIGSFSTVWMKIMKEIKNAQKLVSK